MKSFLIIILTACTIILIFGNIHWNNKTIITSDTRKAQPSAESESVEETERKQR